MKTIIKNLEKQLENLRELVQKRDDTANERSEKWYDSEKGEEYMDKTQEIEDQAYELDNLIDNLKELV